MNTLDLILAAVVGSSVISGAIAGLARSGIGLLSAIAGLIFGFWFYQVPAAFVAGFTGPGLLADVIGFFLVLIPFLILGALIGRFAAALFHGSGLGWMDHLAGAGFGLLRGALVAVALVAVLLALVPKPVPGFISNATSLPYVLGASNIVSQLAPQEMKDAFNNRVAEIEDMWNQQLKKGREELDSLRASSPEKQPEKKR